MWVEKKDSLNTTNTTVFTLLSWRYYIYIDSCVMTVQCSLFECIQERILNIERKLVCTPAFTVFPEDLKKKVTLKRKTLWKRHFGSWGRNVRIGDSDESICALRRYSSHCWSLEKSWHFWWAHSIEIRWKMFKINLMFIFLSWKSTPGI